MVLQGDEALAKAHLVFLEIVLIPMVLLGDECQVETRFGPFGDSVNLDAR
jgi:hypothetical protein